MIAVIYAVVGAINHFKGTSISATGVVGSLFATLGAHIINTFVVPAWNQIAAFVNFFYNVWNDPVAAVKILFLDLANSVIGYVLNMAQAIEEVINNIPGVEVDITSGLDNFRSKIEDMSAKVKSESEWKEIAKTMEYVDYTSAAKAGYEFGSGVEDRVKGAFDAVGNFEHAFGGSGAQDIWEEVANNTGSTAGNTGKIADSIEISEEDLKYMRDIAEREVIDRTVFSTIQVDMGGVNNTVNNMADLDGIGQYLADTIQEQMAVSAEGVHVGV